MANKYNFLKKKVLCIALGSQQTMDFSFKYVVSEES